VARQTVQTAINALRAEGFVRGQVGSGVFIRDQVSLPAASDAEEPLAGVAAYLFEIGSLKNLPRAGWLRLGVPLPESVAEHSFRVASWEWSWPRSKARTWGAPRPCACCMTRLRPGSAT